MVYWFPSSGCDPPGEELNCSVTLEEGLQDAVHDTLGQKPPLEDSMVGTTSADNPLQVVGPADIGYMGGVANVLLEFGSCLRKKLGTPIYYKGLYAPVTMQINDKKKWKALQIRAGANDSRLFHRLIM